MVLDAERLEILRMVEARQITPEEAAQLLAALEAERAQPGPARPGATPANGRWFKVLVEERSGQRVNVSVPLTAVPLALRVVGRWVPDQHRDALQAASDALATDFRGNLVDVEEPAGQHVRIWIE